MEPLNRLWELRDKRFDGWALMDSPIWTILLCISYLTLVKIGQQMMQNRPAFQLKKAMVAYNMVQVLINCLLFYELGQGGWFHSYSFKCQPVDYSDDPMALRMLHVSYWYFISKFNDWFDTVFFVLRKKDSNVSVLHLFHHGAVPIMVWPALRYFPGGQTTFFPLVNTFLHIILYFYYMMSALGPEYQKCLWLRNYFPFLQITHFVLAALHMTQPIFLDDCDYPKFLACWVCGLSILFLVLFLNFHINAYLSARKGDGKKE